MKQNKPACLNERSFKKKVYGVGRVARELDVRYSANGICVIKFAIAENIYNRKTQETEAEFYDCVAFGKLAERLGNLGIEKGEKLQIEGRLSAKVYVNRHGDKSKYTQIILSGFELCGKPKGKKETK